MEETINIILVIIGGLVRSGRYRSLLLFSGFYETNRDNRNMAVVSLIVCVSAVLYGTTATPFIKFYGKYTSGKLNDNPKFQEDKRFDVQKKDNSSLKDFGKKF